MSFNDNGISNPLETAPDMISATDDIAIRVSKLSKCYHIYDAPRDRLKQFVVPRLRRLTGKRSRQYFREFWALKDISFEIKKGEAVGIIGRNGAGKSTLLQMICGTLSPTGGSVKVSGVVAALLELGSGFNPEFTGRENVYLNASVLGLSQEQADGKFEEIAAFADVGDFLDQPTKTYSSGMLMRLAFAVNACINPEILIIDEALGVGDAPFQSKCFKRLRQLIEKGTTILFVSHDISTVRSICNRALWLNHGHTEMWGDAIKVAREYERFCWVEQGVEYKDPTEHKDRDTQNIKMVQNKTNDSDSDNSKKFEWPKKDFSPLDSSGRYGNQAVVIKGFEIRNMYSDLVHSCSYGEKVNFIYYIEVCADIESSVTIGLIFRDIRGVDVFSATNFKNDDKLNVKKGQKIIASAKLEVPLTHQDYVIQIGLFGFKDGQRYINNEYDFSRAIMWDVIEKAIIFTVNPNKPQSLPGPVHVPMYFKFEVI